MDRRPFLGGSHRCGCSPSAEGDIPAAQVSPGGHPLVSLEPVASSTAPLGYNDDVALITEDIACVIDSYEVRIHCGDRSGGTIGGFGSEGDGPGEFRRPAGVERGPNGTVAVIDLQLSRLTLFSTEGTHQSTATMSAQSGEVIWERADIGDVADLECGPVFMGVPDPQGGYVFRACQELLVFFADRDDTTATIVASPTYVAELPSERDVDEYLEGLARLAGTIAQAAGGASVARSAMEPYTAGCREDPKMWFLRGIPFNSTLAALVERVPGPDGIAERAVDWYDISQLGIGT